MQRLTVTDSLGEVLLSLQYAADYPADRIVIEAEREAEAQARVRGSVRWAVTDDAGRLIEGGEARPPSRPGLLAPGAAVVYHAPDLDAPLTAFGAIRAIAGGHYVVAVDHLDSGGQPVPFDTPIELRVPVDTPADGEGRTLAPLLPATAIAAE